MSLVTVKDLYFSYNEQNTIFEGLNLAIKEGEFIFLIGKSGSGKTTLLKLIYNNIFPEIGDINFDNSDYSSINKKNNYKLRRKIGIIFQDFKLLYDRNIYENLYFLMRVTGNKGKSVKNKIIDNISFVGLSHKLYTMPEELSEGEKQRVAIARAMLNDPLLILADEPTGNLDPETTDEILQLLVKINRRGTAILFATHNYKLLKNDYGRIIKLSENKAYNVRIRGAG